MNDSSSQSAKPTFPPSMHKEDLAKRLEELLRQRERLITVLGSSPADGSEEPGETLEKLREENRVLKERLTLLSESNSAEMAERLRSAEEKIALQEAELRKLRLGQPNQESLDAEIQKRDIEIERLKLQISDVGRKRVSEEALKEEIKRLKVDVADALLEQKQLISTAQALKKQIVELKEEIYRYQVQIRDLNTRLEVSKRNEAALAEQEKKLGAELVTLRTLKDEALRMKSEIEKKLGAELEALRAAKDEALRIKNELEERTEILAAENERLSADFETSKTSLAELTIARKRISVELEVALHRCEAAEQREMELASALDALRQEKQVLKDRMDRLLGGVKEYVTYPVASNASSKDAVLEPRELRPYIPFCFPDRLPNQIKPVWLRKGKMPHTHVARTSAATITLGNMNFTSNRRPTYWQYHIAAVSLPGTLENRIPLFRLGQLKEENSLACPDHYALSNCSSRHSLKTMVQYTPIVIYIPVLNPASYKMAIMMPSVNNLSISDQSFSFLIEYLVFTICGRFFSNVDIPEFIFKPASNGELTIVGNYKVHPASEVVAFHTRSNLQFTKLGSVRTELQPDFPQGRLKFLLQTFEDSLNSMMARLDKGSVESSKS